MNEAKQQDTSLKFMLTQTGAFFLMGLVKNMHPTAYYVRGSEKGIKSDRAKYVISFFGKRSG